MNEDILRFIDDSTIGDPNWDQMCQSHRYRMREQLAREIADDAQMRIAEVIQDYDPRLFVSAI